MASRRALLPGALTLQSLADSLARMTQAADEIQAQQEAAKQRFLAAERTRQAKARSAGIKLAVVGTLLNAVNVFVVLTQGRYFVLTTVLGPTMMFLGIWLTIFGQPFDARTGRPAKWGMAGMVGVIAAGVGLSVLALVVLNSG
jgi:hypothetical protein